MAMTINGSTGVVYPDGTSQASGQQACKAWVNFNGTGTVAIRAAFNVTSITDNGTADYTVNFTTAFADTSYAVEATCGNTAASAAATTGCVGNAINSTTGSVRIAINRAFDNANVDTDTNGIAIFR